MIDNGHLAGASLDVFDNVNEQSVVGNKDTLTKDAALGNLLVGKLANIALPANPATDATELKLFFIDKELANLWIAVTWTSA